MEAINVMPPHWKEMTHEEHRQHHIRLHQALDELLADFLMHTHFAKLPSTTSISKLMEWSCDQMGNPSAFDGEESNGNRNSVTDTNTHAR